MTRDDGADILGPGGLRIEGLVFRVHWFRAKFRGFIGVQGSFQPCVHYLGSPVAP